MTLIGYHASHEQYAPSALLDHTRAAEAAGFGGAMCSDHLLPWSVRQPHSGFAWSWLGAALATTGFGIGVVNAPGQRYHPVVIAQAAATLAEMFPGRHWVALGSGQNLNEHVTGGRWPSKSERNERLLECVGIMRALWAGETVTHRGHVVVDEARVPTLPPAPPRVLGAAITDATAGWVATWADGLITVDRSVEELRRVVDAFRGNGGAGKPMALQVQLSYAPSDDEALGAAFDQWRTNVLPSRVLAELRMPEDLDAAATLLEPGDLTEAVRISSDLGRHAAWLSERIELGFDELYLHQVHPDQAGFIRDFGEHVLPGLSAP